VITATRRTAAALTTRLHGPAGGEVTSR
jgi:hypothetical protein